MICYDNMEGPIMIKKQNIAKISYDYIKCVKTIKLKVTSEKFQDVDIIMNSLHTPVTYIALM